jgi:hypothetical protein
LAPLGLLPLLPPETPGAESEDGALALPGSLAVDGALSLVGALSRLGWLAVEGSLAADGALAPVGALALPGAEVCWAVTGSRPAIKSNTERAVGARRRESFMEKYRPVNAVRHRKDS